MFVEFFAELFRVLQLLAETDNVVVEFIKFVVFTFNSLVNVVAVLTEAADLRLQVGNLIF